MIIIYKISLKIYKKEKDANALKRGIEGLLNMLVN